MSFPGNQDSILILTYRYPISELAFATLEEVFEDLRSFACIAAPLLDPGFLEQAMKSLPAQTTVDLHLLPPIGGMRLEVTLAAAHEAMRSNHALIKLNKTLSARAGRSVTMVSRHD